jgi:hypothetical protein
MLAHIQMARLTYAALIERPQWQVTPADGLEQITEKISADKTAGINVRGSISLNTYRRHHPQSDNDNT